MLVSVVIPAFNEANIIQRTLQLIQEAFEANATSGLNWELIVCDNNSRDQTGMLAAEAGATVVFEAENQIAKARNRGASIANGGWLLFIDADTYPSAELIADILKLIHEGIYIGCGTTIRVEGGTLLNKLRMERLNPLFRLFNFSGGAFLLCEREAFDAIRGFSTRLYAYEEIDFVVRLKGFARKQGKKFKVLHQYPAVTSGRKGGYTFGGMLRLFGSNTAAVLLFILNYVLPGSWVGFMGRRMLGYWYDDRN